MSKSLSVPSPSVTRSSTPYGSQSVSSSDVSEPRVVEVQELADVSPFDRIFRLIKIVADSGLNHRLLYILLTGVAVCVFIVHIFSPIVQNAIFDNSSEIEQLKSEILSIKASLKSALDQQETIRAYQTALLNRLVTMNHEIIDLDAYIAKTRADLTISINSTTLSREMATKAMEKFGEIQLKQSEILNIQNLHEEKIRLTESHYSDVVQEFNEFRSNYSVYMKEFNESIHGFEALAENASLVIEDLTGRFYSLKDDLASIAPSVAPIGTTATCESSSFSPSSSGNTIKTFTEEDLRELVKRMWEDEFSSHIQPSASCPPVETETETCPPPSSQMAAAIAAADFAQPGAGATVVLSDTSQTFSPFPSWSRRWMVTQALSSLGLESGVGGPAEALSADMRLGHCWAMQGDEGRLTVRLLRPVVVTAVSIDHIPRSIAVDIRSAPKRFEVLGRREADGDLIPLVRGSYNALEESSHSQNFSARVGLGAFEFITLRILNNHGHPDYTCLYKLRVHGHAL